MLFYGDSITEGQGIGAGNTYPDQCLVLLDSDWTGTNLGFDGWQVDTMLANVAAQCDTRYNTGLIKNVVLANGGVNDLGNGRTAAAIYADLLSLWAHLRNKGFKVVASTVTITHANQAQRPPLNALIRGDASKYDTLADFDADTRLQNPDDLTYYRDGVHPTTAGYAVMASIAATAIQAL